MLGVGVKREYATFETADANAEPNGAATGRDVLARLVAALPLRPSASISAIAEHDGYGWAVDIHLGAGRVWCMLQRSDEWLLITVSRRSLLDRIRGRHFAEQHEEVVAWLDEGLRAIGVRDLKWFARAAFEAQAR